MTDSQERLDLAVREVEKNPSTFWAVAWSLSWDVRMGQLDLDETWNGLHDALVRGGLASDEANALLVEQFFNTARGQA